MPRRDQLAWPYWNDVQTYAAYNTTANMYIWNDVWANNSTTSATNVYVQTRRDAYAWDTWNADYTGRGAYITANRIWNQWAGVGTGQWNATAGAVTAPAVRAFQAAAVPLVRTEEEWAVIREEQERLRAERDLLQGAARAEARKLLAIVLSPEQLAAYDRDKEFTVVGSHGGIFKLKHGTSGNVKQIVDGQEVSVLCVHPKLLDHRTDEEGPGYLPTEDSLIGQVLAIMHDEHTFVQTAFVHRGQRHLTVVREAA